MLTSGFIKNKTGKEVAKWAFTDRQDGQSQAPFNSLNLATHVGDQQMAVAFNRSQVLAEFGFSDATWPGPVHGVDIGMVEKSVGLFADVDGLITTRSKSVLCTLGADCVPLIAVEPEKKLALTGHIGWQGAAAEFHRSVINAIKNAGGDIKQTQILLGPAICGNCYQVPAARIEQVIKVLPAAQVDGGLDLRLGLQQIFKPLVNSVEIVGGCTFESENLFSFRRDGQTGRQAGLVVLL